MDKETMKKDFEEFRNIFKTEKGFEIPKAAIKTLIGKMFCCFLVLVLVVCINVGRSSKVDQYVKLSRQLIEQLSKEKDFENPSAEYERINKKLEVLRTKMSEEELNEAYARNWAEFGKESDKKQSAKNSNKKANKKPVSYDDYNLVYPKVIQQQGVTFGFTSKLPKMKDLLSPGYLNQDYSIYKNERNSQGCEVIYRCSVKGKTVCDFIIDYKADEDNKTISFKKVVAFLYKDGDVSKISKSQQYECPDFVSEEYGGYELGAFYGAMKEFVPAIFDVKKMNEVFDKQMEAVKALMDAVAEERIDDIKSLIKNGVDINAKDDDGINILMGALEIENSDIAKLLIEKGADVNARDYEGRTVLMYALGNGNLDIAKLLIEKGADVNAKDNEGRTPLMYGGIAELLIKKGADVNAKDNNGRTVLMHYIESFGECALDGISDKSLDIIKILLKNKADPNIKDEFGDDLQSIYSSAMPPSQEAREIGWESWEKIEKLLKKYGYKPSDD